MSDFEEVVKSKTNEELVDIFVNAADYQPEFLALAEAEVVKRNIPLESLKSIREQKESIDERITQVKSISMAPSIHAAYGDDFCCDGKHA